MQKGRANEKFYGKTNYFYVFGFNNDFFLYDYR